MRSTFILTDTSCSLTVTRISSLKFINRCTQPDVLRDLRQFYNFKASSALLIKVISKPPVTLLIVFCTINLAVQKCRVKWLCYFDNAFFTAYQPIPMVAFPLFSITVFTSAEIKVDQSRTWSHWSQWSLNTLTKNVVYTQSFEAVFLSS